MSEDKAYQLVCKLFNDYNYNGSQWEIDTQIDSYYNCLKSRETDNKEYDYDKMYRLIEKEYKYKTVIPKPLLLDFQKRCVKHIYDTTRDGQLLVIICYCLDADNNPVFRRVYDFVIDNNTDNGKSASSYEYQLKERYEIVKSKFYPAGSTLTGSWKRGFKVYYLPTQTEIYSEIIVTEEECELAKEFELARAS